MCYTVSKSKVKEETTMKLLMKVLGWATVGLFVLMIPLSVHLSFYPWGFILGALFWITFIGWANLKQKERDHEQAIN